MQSNIVSIGWYVCLLPLRLLSNRSSIGYLNQLEQFIVSFNWAYFIWLAEGVEQSRRHGGFRWHIPPKQSSKLPKLKHKTL